MIGIIGEITAASVVDAAVTAVGTEGEAEVRAMTDTTTRADGLLKHLCHCLVDLRKESSTICFSVRSPLRIMTCFCVSTPQWRDHLQQLPMK